MDVNIILRANKENCECEDDKLGGYVTFWIERRNIEIEENGENKGF